jgi:hypothetical protein
MGCPSNSDATANIAFIIIWPHKPHHYVKVGIPFGVLYELGGFLLIQVKKNMKLTAQRLV